MRCAESKSNYQINKDTNFQTIESRIELFREIAQFHTNGKFDTANIQTKEIYNNIFKYCNMQDGKYDCSKGLYIFGSVGSGKTTLLKIVSDYMRKIYPAHQIKKFRPKKISEYNLIDDFKGYCGGFRSINATSIANEYKMSKNGSDCLSEYCKKEIEICFDELGREPMPIINYGTSLNVFQYILAIRYDNWSNARTEIDRLNARTYITTNIQTFDNQGNISLNELSQTYEVHIADRIREMCNIICLDGKTYRKASTNK